jgi:hypothetical protein
MSDDRVPLPKLDHCETQDGPAGPSNIYRRLPEISDRLKLLLTNFPHPEKPGPRPIIGSFPCATHGHGSKTRGRVLLHKARVQSRASIICRLALNSFLSQI